MNEEREWANAWRYVPEEYRPRMKRLLEVTISDEIDGDWFWWAIILIQNVKENGRWHLFERAEDPQVWEAARRAHLRRLALEGSESLQAKYGLA
jgi:hypothetical protein